MVLKRRHIIPFLVLMTFFPGRTFAQKYLREGDRYFGRNLFEEAIPFYLKEIKKGHYKYRNEARERLASCYRLTGRFLEAAEEYKQILDRSSRLNKPENYLNYANSLKNGAKYAEAAEQFKKYIQVAPNDPMGEVYLESCYMAQKWLDEIPEYEVANIDVINSPEPDFAPVLFQNGIIFTSSRKGSTKKFINFSENIGVVNTDLYYVDLQNLTGEDPVRKIPGLDSYMHDGDATFSADSSEVYFTRTIMGDKNRRSNTVLSSLQVYYSKKDPTGNWSEPVSAFNFNNDKYSVGQPSLSRDGKSIFFISDMPGGKGETDIYFSTKQRDGNWSEPVNLGDSVNTFGHELFPSIAGGDTLYFSSDTHPGMGKLDIFRAVKKEGKWGDVTNMKPPINSIGDDFGIVFNTDQTMGFFSSDRFNGKGKDDIYSIYKERAQVIYFAGHKVQIPDNSLFNGITYKIGKNGSKNQVPLVSRNGMYEYSLDEDSLYTLVMRKNGFFFDAVSFSLKAPDEKGCVSVNFHSGSNDLFVGGYAVEAVDKTVNDSVRSTENGEAGGVIIPVVKDKFLSGTTVELYTEGARLNNVVTNDQGFYLFPDTLGTDKDYRILALKAEPVESTVNKIPEPPAKNEKILPAPDADEKTSSEITSAPAIKDVPIEAQSVLADNTEKEKLPVIETVEQPVEPGDVAEVTVNRDESKTAREEPAVSTTEVMTALPEIRLKGTIRNAGTGQPLSDCDIVMYESGTEVRYLTDTDFKGDFELKVKTGQQLKMVVSRTGFFQAEKDFRAGQLQAGETAVNVFLEPIEVNKAVRLNNILFDYNKASLRESSKTELDNLARFLKVNPDVVIELNGHTDARGSYYSNLILSGRRVASARSYLIDKGIAGERIMAHGYGESFPIIKNARTEKDHELNRRIEFTVVDKNKLTKEQYTENHGMYILSACPYSEILSFPRNPKLPDSTFYRVNLGHYNEPVAKNRFDGLFPVVEEYDTNTGMYSYYAGFFKTYDDAEKAGRSIEKYTGTTVRIQDRKDQKQ
ncbi:MAG TPA: OmpA family protein, partial [Bacteroidales bacterium]|nr:OmpA family protein [Bacteroidales bacterium]